MKRILYLSFYFEPDLCAGSFRNSPLAIELAKQLNGKAEVEVFTSMPNRYSTYNQTALQQEIRGNLIINRIEIPQHKSGLLDQVKSFNSYYSEVKKLTKKKKYDLVFASSSRLFTAYLGHSIAKKQKIKLYLDIRDIFYDGLKDLLNSNIIKQIALPIIKQIEIRSFSNANHINLISAGFLPYFERYTKPVKTSFPNGIDDEFLLRENSKGTNESDKKVVIYAGNIGEGQGLHKIVPELANNFPNSLEFLIIGDGGAKSKLIEKLDVLKCTNVELRDPISRKQLLEEYDKADYYLIHLNDFDAFKKVLPSKVFELGAYNKPIIAGVAGFAAKFIKENMTNVLLFNPCDVDDCTKQLRDYKYQNVERTEFIDKFLRKNINKEMAKSIISYL
jgi:glycosyltransferase involved in cell wall biosynthesis